MNEIKEIVNSKVKFTHENGKIKKTKIFLPVIILATSIYYSLSFALGIVIGYLICRLFCHFFIHSGKVDLIFLDCGKWRIHLHHWIMGIMFLSVMWLIDLFYLPAFFAGFIFGIIIQDIYDYNDWHKIIIKNKTKKE